jgi:acyl-CoA dehydrogenase
MDFALTDEQKLLIDSVRRFIKEELLPLEEEIERNDDIDPKVARSIYEKSKSLGLYALNMPEEFGGGGLSAFDSMLVEEQFGHTTDILVRRAFGDVYDALLACRGEQVDRWLRPAVTGERVCGFAITETGAGSDAQGVKTTASQTDDGGWTLSGTKHFISDAECSDCFIVSARTGPKEISLFLVDKGLPGFTVGRRQRMMGLRGTTHNELVFDNVKLEPVALLGERGAGFKLVMSMLGRVRLSLIGARAVGRASHVLEMMTEYAGMRQQFGKPIGEFQLIQEMIADSVIEINAARLMVLRAAWMLDQGLDARGWIAMVKVQASEMLNRVVDRGVQVFGGMGYCREMPLERYYRDARIFRIFDGTSEIHRVVIARTALKQGAALFDLHR